MIKFLVMDVDGTLTNGKVYMGDSGEAFKAFDIKDGCGIKELLPQYGIVPIVITARNSKILVNRCSELGITEIHQGIRDKLNCLNDIIKSYSNESCIYTYENVAYVGDDLLDIQCMEPVKAAGGIAACPIDAIPKVIAICDYVATHKGGEGAVRDVIEYIIQINENQLHSNYIIVDRINAAIDYISKLDFNKLCVGKYHVNDVFYYSVQEYFPPDNAESIYESHKKYVDIQWIVSGREKLFITDINTLRASTPYNEDVDVINYFSSNNMSSVVLSPGDYAVLFPKDAHRVEKYANNPSNVKKIVGKIMLR